MKTHWQKMSAAVQSAFPSALSPYWRTLPMARLTRLLVGTFFTVFALGFAADLLQINTPHLAGGFFWPVLLGGAAVVMFAARIKKPRLSIPLSAAAMAICWLGFRATSAAPTVPISDALHTRIIVDALGIWLGAALGFRLLVSFITSEGLEGVRMQTELSLAHGIQETLVPAISFKIPCFEAYGKSVPSTEMGGDLIDVVGNGAGMLAYIADISGHGLPAGQLMGMLKTAMRVALQFHSVPASLLESADRVLPAVKAPDMYATLALMVFDGSTEVEYALAGHPPILHYRARSRDTARLAMEQFPLGLIPGGRYASARVAFAPGDLFVLLTDGIPDVVNTQDEEFGLDRVEQLMSAHASEPLPRIWDAIMDAAARHGLAEDDQTLLLLRPVADT